MTITGGCRCGAVRYRIYSGWGLDAVEVAVVVGVAGDEAVAAGLRFRPLSETIKDTKVWFETTRGKDDLKAGISWEREQLLLHKWHERHVRRTEAAV